MKSEEIAYLAGILDGEGSFGIIRYRRKNGEDYYYNLRVRVGLSVPERDFLESLTTIWGGSVGLHRKGTEKKYPVHIWTVTGESAYKVLRACEPYLRIKKRQAGIGIKCYEYGLKKGGFSSSHGEFEPYFRE